MLTICPKCGNRKKELNAYCTNCKPTLGSIKAMAVAEVKKAKGIDIRSLNRIYGGDANIAPLTKAPIEAKIKIIAKAKEEKIKVEWQYSQCDRCSRQVEYLPTWSSIPSSCHFCRLRDVTGNGIAKALNKFLLNEYKLQKNCRINGEDKQLLVSRKPLREKIQRILQCGMDELIEACAKDDKIRKIVYMVVRENKIKVKRPRTPSIILPKYTLPFYQGGAPGLGKKS